MSRLTEASAALPIAHAVLRVLIVVNWLTAGVILALLFAVPTNAWIMSSLELTPGPVADRVIVSLKAIAVIGLIAIPLHYAVLTRLLAMVDTVRAGDPFVAENAARLQAIGWVLLVLQLLSLVIGAIAESISTPAHPIEMAGFSINGWLAVLLTFLLARVFAAGTVMRDDLAGTV